MSSKTLAGRGPKTPEGKLAVRLNAAQHGILSIQPVVTPFERLEDWESHRDAILDSLAPEGGMEQVLAERVALCSWRLNRVVLFESETIAGAQEGVVESVRLSRKRELEDERILASLKGEGKVLTDLGILIEAHPENVLDDLRMARNLYKAVQKLFDSPPDAIMKAEDAASVLYLAAFQAVKVAAHQAGEELKDEAVGAAINSLAESFLERLPSVSNAERPIDVDSLPDISVRELRELIEWLAREAGIEPDSQTVDGFTKTPEETLMERLHTEARYDLGRKEAKAEKVQEQLLAARRNRILPNGGDLQKIGRYESHLSRQMYQALHELEALQARRRGGPAPLARVDVQTS